MPSITVLTLKMLTSTNDYYAQTMIKSDDQNALHIHRRKGQLLAEKTKADLINQVESDYYKGTSLASTMEEVNKEGNVKI